MARVWVTGSADGIGRATAQAMVAGGHDVLLHARTAEKAALATAAVPGAIGVVVADLESMSQTRGLVEQVAAFGVFDAIVHNAGVLERRNATRPVTGDGLERTFAVNVIAPYLLTVLLPLPRRMVYLSSQLHLSGDPDFDDLQFSRRRYDGDRAYNDSKLMVTALGFALAAAHPDVQSNVVDPGWVRSRMGGPGAAVPLATGAAGPVRMAVGATTATGTYVSERSSHAHPLAADPAFTERVVAACEQVTGVPGDVFRG